MNFKNKIIGIFLFLSINALAQTGNIREVTVKGLGLNRDGALQDAFRNAISSAAGVALTAETRMENFMVVEDAVQTKASGYINKYNVINEGKSADGVWVEISASVSLDPLKADVALLGKAIGGVRFMVAYDPNVKRQERDLYDFAIERINQALSERKYRYIEKSRFDELRNEASNIGETYRDSSNEISYVQQLGMRAGAQFMIYIKNISTQSRSEAFDTRSSSKVTMAVKAYDNCTAEGLGTILLESKFISGREGDAALKQGIQEAIAQDIDKLLGVFATYIGDWANNGTPFEFRFYQSGTFRDFRDLRGKLKSDPKFGGDFEVVSTENYTKINCTYKEVPDEIAYKVLDYADEVATFKALKLDVKYMFGRQINFAPSSVKIASPQASSILTTPTENKPPANESKPNTEPATKKPSSTNKKVPTSRSGAKKTK